MILQLTDLLLDLCRCHCAEQHTGRFDADTVIICNLVIDVRHSHHRQEQLTDLVIQ